MSAPGTGGLPDDLAELDAALREELRAEAEEAEREARTAAFMARSLLDVALEAMARGDVVAVTTGGGAITGVIVHVAGDLLSMMSGPVRVDVNGALPVMLRVLRRSRSGGRSRGRHEAGGLRARLLELALDQPLIEVATVLAADRQVGRLEAVGADHLLVADPSDGQETVIALAAVAFVRLLSAPL